MLRLAWRVWADSLASSSCLIFPFLLQVTSQHPYAEMFIGKPHVYTINIKNLTEVHAAVQEILQEDVVRICLLSLCLLCLVHAQVCVCVCVCVCACVYVSWVGWGADCIVLV